MEESGGTSISIVNAVEIFTHPDDLQIKIIQEKDDNRYAIGIYRGPGNNFSPLIVSPPFTNKLEDAVEAVQERMEAIQQYMEKELANPASHLLPYLIPGREVLNQDLIDRICDELQQRHVANTYEW